MPYYLIMDCAGQLIAESSTSVESLAPDAAQAFQEGVEKVEVYQRIGEFKPITTVVKFVKGK